MRRRRLLITAGLCLGVTPTLTAADRFEVTLDPAIADEPQSGRLLFFFVTQAMPRWERIAPMNAPFFIAPQPIASVDVRDWTPGTTMRLDAPTVAWPAPISELDIVGNMQVVLDVDQTERSHDAGPGNLYSDIQRITLSSDAEDSITCTLTKRIEPRPMPTSTDRVQFVEWRSSLLSAAAGHDVYHRAGVVLPHEYADDPDRHWPAVYVIPGYGGRHTMARRYAGRSTPVPHAVYIVLDCESPLGHHGFVDSPNHGPRATALVEEFIPHLERMFRLKSTPAKRIVTGHSSGGWSSLWLQLHYPDVFGACFSSAPDPVDFRAFSGVNIYKDENMFVDATGGQRPSYRSTNSDGVDTVRMTIAEENGMEWAIHPRGGSGQQWDAWEAMFSPRDEATGLPVPLFDPRTGAIDHEVARHWARYDIGRLVRSNWETFGPIMRDRVRLVCGSVDSFYLEDAVIELGTAVDERLGGETGAGYVRIIDGADHGSVWYSVREIWANDMAAFLDES